MIRLLFVLLLMAIASGIHQPIQNPTAQQQELPPEAVTEQVRAIKPPKNPLPAEAASANVTKYSFFVYGDTRGRRDGWELQYEHSLIINSMLSNISKRAKTDYPVRFVLQTGDGVSTGRIGRQWNASYIELIDRLTQIGDVPYFLAAGNHDLSSASTHEAPNRQPGLNNYLAANKNLLPPDGSQRRLDGYPVFSFGYGNTFVIAIDSNIAGDDKQFEWVRAQLEGLDRTRYRHVFFFAHHPAFSSGPHGGASVERPTAIIRERYMPLFHKHHVRIFFSGHDHTYEHWIERYKDESGNHRLDHITTGGGGAPLYTYSGDPDIRPYIQAHSKIDVTLDRIAKPGYEPGDGAYHYVIVRVDGDKIELEVVGVDWGRNYQPYRSNKADLSDGN